MQRWESYKLILIFLVVLVVPTYSQRDVKSQDKNIGLKLDQVIANPDEYLNKTITLQIAQLTSFDSSMIDDLDCPNKHRPVLPHYSGDEAHIASMVKSLSKGSYVDKGLFKTQIIVTGSLETTKENILVSCPCFKFRIDKIEQILPPPKGKKLFRKTRLQRFLRKAKSLFRQ